MNFYRKVFLSIFLTSFLLGLALLWFSLFSVRKEMQKLYVDRYLRMTDMVSNALLETEASVAIRGISAVKHLSLLVSTKGIPTDGELKALAAELDVNLFAITNHKGKFLRDTITPPSQQTHILFDFCADYAKLLTGESKLEVTPILPSFPYKGPFKFVMMPNLDKTLILEAGLHLSSIATILSKTLRTDENIRSIGVFSPNGFNFGTIFSDGHFEDGGQNKGPATLQNGVVFRENLMEVEHKVLVDGKQCCECKMKGVVGGAEEYFYILKLTADTAPLNKILKKATLITVFFFLILVLVSAALSHWIALRLVKRLVEVESAVKEMSESGALLKPIPVEGSDEFSSLAVHFNQMSRSLEALQKSEVQIRTAEALGEQARQLAHDIRSPIAALNAGLKDIGFQEDKKRKLITKAIQRITDIANGLTKRDSQSAAEVLSFENAGSLDLLAVVDGLMSEKRLQYSEMEQINMSTHVERGYGLFSKISSSDLARVLSNAVNNSVEAMKQGGSIQVTLSQEGNYALLEIVDDGPGIPLEIRAKIAEKGVTHGKVHGSGLGLYHAKSVVEAAGGRFEVVSSAETGTKIRLYLPLIKGPEYFPHCLKVKGDGIIVVVDDDLQIHELWMERWKNFPEHQIKCFSSVDVFENWMANNSSKDFLFLVDQEIEGSPIFGFDLILKHRIESKSVLVTSRADDPELLKRAIGSGVKVLAKSQALLIPIEIV